MTHIRSTLVAALLTFGAAAVASAQSANSAPQAARAQHQKGPGRHHGDRALLKGITLSDGEKADLQSVHARYAPQMKATRKQSKQLMKAERADLRAALSAENRSKFDANVQSFHNRSAQHAKKGAKRSGTTASF